MQDPLFSFADARFQHQGPVVQSIVSLTKSLVNDSLSLLVRLKSSVLTAKAPHIFFFGKKWQCFYV